MVTHVVKGRVPRGQKVRQAASQGAGLAGPGRAGPGGRGLAVRRFWDPLLTPVGHDVERFQFGMITRLGDGRDSSGQLHSCPKGWGTGVP